MKIETTLIQALELGFHKTTKGIAILEPGRNLDLRQLEHDFQTVVRPYRLDMLSNINYVTVPFYDAAVFACTKISMQDMIADLPSKLSGMFIMGALQLGYVFETTGLNTVCKMIGFNHNAIMLFKWDAPTSFDYFKWLEKDPEEGKPGGIRTGLKMIINGIFITEYFKRYAEVETKIIPAKGKQKVGFTCIYNNSHSTVLHLDSKWFTTLVKSEAFKVRGHFRLQPYGPKLAQKKLIYINSFEKTGYTAPARKLKLS